MDALLRQVSVWAGGACVAADIAIEQGRIAAIAPDLPADAGVTVYDFPGCVVFPGFTDVHVHLREPGFSYKESIASGSRAAAHGGYTTVCPMPNLDPVPDSRAHLQAELELIRRDAVVHVLPYGALSVGEQGERLADLAAMAPDVVAFSDDGRGVQDEDLMRRAMRECKRLGKILAAHCEDNSLLRGGYIHDGAYAARHGYRGICAESEWRQVERDLRLAGETGCAYHVCHVSTRESVRLIREAQRAGIDVSAETAPHYLTLTEDDLQEDGRFKMNPPLRTAADREALLAAVADGTIAMIATDHAPHSREEKARGLAGSPMGVVGLETAFPVLYTRLVKTGLLPLSRLLALLTEGPRKRFGVGAELQAGAPADLTVFDLAARQTVDPERFLSQGRSTPFAGEEVLGRCRLTLCGGRPVWQEEP